MDRTHRRTWTRIAVVLAGLLLAFARTLSAAAERPNILWITSEDNSPLLGCYGDAQATTPHLDAMAAAGVRYTNAFANVPVCAPARFCILTGLHAAAMGTLHMRSRYRVPDFVRPLPRYLRDAGYYCTNKSKTDYNFKTKDKSHWDACGGGASYRNRDAGQPFFSVINLMTTHESKIHGGGTPDHDPAAMDLPPYHPDIPAVRRDTARYYDQIEQMDDEVGDILAQLEADGVAENTIVFYYADHGGVLCRSKRFVYDTGTRVPLIVRFPERYRHLAPGDPGTSCDRLVSFVDLAPTVLSLAGIDVPGHMHGAAFLGEQQAPEPEAVFVYRGRMDERIDLVRGAHDGRYAYFRNYMPHRIYAQRISYLWRAESVPAWEEEYRQGRCDAVQSRFWERKPSEELYDTRADPWQVHNLATDPEHAGALQRLRGAVADWTRDIQDVGFFPEATMVARAGGGNIHAVVRDEAVPLDRIIAMAEAASSHDPGELSRLIDGLADAEVAIRFWAATGCGILAHHGAPAADALGDLLTDPSQDVRIAAAEALCRIGAADEGLPALAGELDLGSNLHRLHAANAIDALGARALSELGRIRSARQDNSDWRVRSVLGDAIDRLEALPSPPGELTATPLDP